MAISAESIDIDRLPEAFAMRNEDGSIDQIVDPCYNLLSPGYYGDTWFDEGEIIRTWICPNYEMQPLNKAAAVNMKKWLESLPDTGIRLTMEDTVEAAMMLRNHPDVEKMTHDQAAETVRKLAMKLKMQRENPTKMFIPPVQHNEARPASRSNAPAMPNTRFTDPTARGPSLDRSVLHEPRRGEEVARRAKPAVSNPPPSAGR